MKLDLVLKLFQRRLFDSKNTPAPKIFKLANGYPSGVDVLVYGDSVSERVSRYDNDVRSLSLMLESLLMDKMSVFSITHSAYNASIFNLLTRAIFALDIKPSKILVPINLRSFSPQWFLNPLFQCAGHQKELLSVIMNKSQSVTGQTKIFNTAIGEFLGTEVRVPGEDCLKVVDFQKLIHQIPKSEAGKKSRKRSIFLYHYMSLLRMDHYLLQALKDIAAISKANNVRALFYFTPINYVAGLKYAGEEFVKTVKRNISVVSETLFTESVSDLSMSLTPDSFFTQDDSTEHLNAQGRLSLATNLQAICLGSR